MSEHPTFNPGFPVSLYQEGMELPKEGTFFVVAGNGLWMHKDTGVVQAFVPVDRISVLKELQAEAWAKCKLPKLPDQQVCQIKTFFQKVVELHHSEASVTLYYNKVESQYKIYVPPQRVTGAGVHYRRKGVIHVPGLEGYLRVGTIHSHCDFGAFHSGVDRSDEEDFDGLHCTFGHNNREVFSVSASVVVNNHRWKVDPLEVLDGIERVGVDTFKLMPTEDVPTVEEWLKRVRPFGQSDKIEKGNVVEWAGNMSVVPFRNTCGEGPFRVDGVDGEQITIETNVGLARFSSKLFRKVDHETDSED